MKLKLRVNVLEIEIGAKSFANYAHFKWVHWIPQPDN